EGTGASLQLLMLIPIWSRFFLPAAIAWWPYARKNSGGMGAQFANVRNRHVWLAGAIASVSSAIGYVLLHSLLRLHGVASVSLAEFAVILVATFIVTMVCGLALAAAIARQLGGQTGDTYGAINEMLEIILLLVTSLAMGLS